MNTQSEMIKMPTLMDKPSLIRTAIHEFSEDDSHENWLKLSKMFQEKFEENQSIRVELLKGIVGHLLSSK